MLKSLSPILLALVIGAAQAGPNVLEVVAPALRRVSSDEAAEVRGAYDMSDGRTMLISRRGSRLLVALDRVPVTEVLAITGNRMLSRDRNMELVFDTADNGLVRTVKVVLSNELAAAGGTPMVLAGGAR